MRVWAAESRAWSRVSMGIGISAMAVMMSVDDLRSKGRFQACKPQVKI